jgi:hypothetical protein
MNSLQADQLLLSERERQWLAEGGAAVCRYRGVLRIRQPAVRANAAKEVAAHRARVGRSRLGPGPEPRRDVNRIGGRSELAGGRRTGGEAGIVDAGPAETGLSGGGRVRRIGRQATADQVASDPHLRLVGRNPVPLPVPTVRAFA